MFGMSLLCCHAWSFVTECYLSGFSFYTDLGIWFYHFINRGYSCPSLTRASLGLAFDRNTLASYFIMKLISLAIHFMDIISLYIVGVPTIIRACIGVQFLLYI